MGLSDAFHAKVQRNAKQAALNDAFDTILSALEKQQALFEAYEEEKFRKQESLEEAEARYQTQRRIYNKDKPSYQQAKDGDSFTFKNTPFFGDYTSTKPNPRDYEVYADDFISPEKLGEKESTIMWTLSQTFGEHAARAFELVYKDVPDLLDIPAQKRLDTVKRKTGKPVNTAPEHLELGQASVAIKIGNPSLIDKQIKIVKNMQRSPDPLNPRKGFFQRMLGR